MRDPNRIGPMLELLRTIWEKRPDLRLGQLILNAVGEPKLYHAEDDFLAKRLKESYK